MATGISRSTSFVNNAIRWLHSHNGQQPQNKTTGFGSSVAIHKLRESKWFGPDEHRTFCAVVECGFIVEVRVGEDNWFGVVICKSNKDKKPTPGTIEIYSVKIKENGQKVIKVTLADLWKQKYTIKINNFADKQKLPHSEKDIKDQVLFARKAKQQLWHDSKQFTYWCRYGSRQQDIRRRHMSECVKWGSVGMNAGMVLIMNNRQKSYSTSK